MQKIANSKKMKLLSVNETKMTQNYTREPSWMHQLGRESNQFSLLHQTACRKGNPGFGEGGGAHVNDTWVGVLTLLQGHRCQEIAREELRAAGRDTGPPERREGEILKVLYEINLERTKISFFPFTIFSVGINKFLSLCKKFPFAEKVSNTQIEVRIKKLSIIP